MSLLLDRVKLGGGKDDILDMSHILCFPPAAAEEDREKLRDGVVF
jgi:hypothetical protein